MNRSYRLGISIVLGVIVVAAGLAPLVPSRTRPAAEDLSIDPKPLGEFRLVERSGKAITQADLADTVWVADFIFTRCPSSCPILTRTMAEIQKKLAGTDVRLVSLTVDPEHDTAERLAEYARKNGADPDRWWFLTGSKDVIYELLLKRFQVGVQASSAEEQAKFQAEAVSHSSRLVLVDRGNRVVGLFSSEDPSAIAALVSKARQRDMGWVLNLPTVNATLNGSCAVLLMVAWTLIRAGRPRAHAACMATALAVSAIFLSCYLVYHYFVGSVPFRGSGAIRLVYFTILLSHTTLAVVAVPLILLSVYRALRGRYVEHARIARVTFPIWLYVSITGVVVYFMLYRMDVPASMG